jgi:hypothetical protein
LCIWAGKNSLSTREVEMFKNIPLTEWLGIMSGAVLLIAVLVAF